MALEDGSVGLAHDRIAEASDEHGNECEQCEEDHSGRIMVTSARFYERNKVEEPSQSKRRARLSAVLASQSVQARC